jgi:hypothetical protein
VACHDVLMREPLVFVVSATVAACGGRSPGSGFSPADASVSSQDSGVLDGPFPCGAQPGVVCEAAQYCIIGCSGGGPIFCTAFLDSGACPPGTALSAVAVCPGDAAPCSSEGSGYPTTCVDDLDATACPNPGPVGPPRTFECNCPL